MALRALQIIVPKRHDIELADLLCRRPAGSAWTVEVDGERLLSGVLIDSDEAEVLVDKLTDRFGAVEGFRVISVPVEASVPGLPKRDKADQGEAPDPEDPEAAQDEKRRKAAAHRVSRDELIQDVQTDTSLSKHYFIMVVASTLVAGIGLLKDNVAVVIGAMVIAPLLGPNIALSLATTLAHGKLFRQAIVTNAAGLSVGLAISLAMGLVLTVDPSVGELQARTSVDLSDILLALASGVAGALAFTRGAPTALVGVMVAVALMPPLVAVGLLAGSGNFQDASKAVLLLATNVICVNLAGVATFLLRGVSPRSWWDAGRARKATVTAILFWTVLLLVLVVVLSLADAEVAV